MTKREQALQKIASLLGTDYEEPTQELKQQSNLMQKVAEASAALVKAAQSIRLLRQDNEKLAQEVSDLKEKIATIEKHDEAEKLANTMVQKGMLKKADIENKTMELMQLDSEGFEIIKDAISQINVEKTASYMGETGFDFMYETDAEIEPETPTMADAAANYIPNNKNFF